MMAFISIFQAAFLLICWTSFFLPVLSEPSRYTSIFSFVDSLADTGNYLLSGPVGLPGIAHLPYGETFFHHPTGRCSDGRLIVDFIAAIELVPLPPKKLRTTGRSSGFVYMDCNFVSRWVRGPYLKSYVVSIDFLSAEACDLPPLPPHFARKELGNYTHGVNFAVVGATALDPSFFTEKNITGVLTNYSLSIQLDWFRKIVPSLCSSSTYLYENGKYVSSHSGVRSCQDYFKRSLFLVGEIGGNDFNAPLLKGSMTLDQVKPYVPLVVAAIADSVTKLIEQGAVELMVPGNLPIGCNTAYLTAFRSQNQSDYDPKTGCLKRYNEFAVYYNLHLEQALEHLREKHPHSKIIYADYYNSFMRFMQTPTFFGFEDTLKACCRAPGEPYNFSFAKRCGTNGSGGCKDPSKYVNWDGIHLTERAYQWMAHAFTNGLFTKPPLKLRGFCH